ncbi:hypothetical protein PS623_03418 [Pseudomonas fluorescens]|nr:hypothetical protein PS623_03418 [Pseudomonas fluorescens]
MAITPGKGAQVGDDRGHAPGQLADQLEVAAGVFGTFMVEQHFGVFGVAADRRQRLVELVADACRHGAEHRQLAGLDQLVLSADQFLLGALAFEHGAFQQGIKAFEVGGPGHHAVFQVLSAAGFEVDAVDIVAPALHHQTGQQDQHQQCAGANCHDRLHRAVDEDVRGKDAHLPAGFLDVAGLDQPGLGVEVERLRCLGRVGLDGEHRRALRRSQRAGGTEAPVRARGQHHYAVLIGQQQLLGGIAPESFGVVEVDLDHQHADHPLAIAHRSREEVAALG